MEDMEPLTEQEIASVFADLAARHPCASPGDGDVPYGFYALAPLVIHDIFASRLRGGTGSH